MKITYQLKEREKKFLMVLNEKKSRNRFSKGEEDKAFRDKYILCINSFISAGLIKIVENDYTLNAAGKIVQKLFLLKKPIIFDL